MASIQFSRGMDEEVIPEVRLTRSKSGEQGTAVFIFEKPNALSRTSTEEITGMYLLDEDGELSTRDIKARFINGEPTYLEATYLMNTTQEWERFMCFMKRYASEHGLGFTESGQSGT